MCIIVTGCPTVPNVNANFNFTSLVPRITGSDGSYMICVTLPRNRSGLLKFRIESGNDTEDVHIRVS